MNGFGKFYYSNGKIYEGDFENGLKNGYGVMTYNNKVIQKGIYFNGDFVDSNVLKNDQKSTGVSSLNNYKSDITSSYISPKKEKNGKNHNINFNF